MLKTIAIASAFSLASLSANAELLDFDDIAVNTWSQYTSLTSYHGYDFTGGAALINKDYHPVSGYHNGIISGTNGLFNQAENDIVITKTGGGVFDLTSAYITAAWEKDVLVNATGWLNGQKVSWLYFYLDPTTPTSPIQFDFKGVDKITFGYSLRGDNAGLGGGGAFFVVDNLVLNPIAPVPEPSTYAMMFAGLGAVGLMARRRKLGN